MLAAFRELSRDAGRESNRRANEQAAEMDRTGRLLGVHLRVLGTSSDDRRRLTPGQVTELHAAFMELSRDAGRISNQRANEQVAEMDGTGRLLGVHLRFLGIDSNDRRRRTPDEVTSLKAASMDVTSSGVRSLLSSLLIPRKRRCAPSKRPPFLPFPSQIRVEGRLLSTFSFWEGLRAMSEVAKVMEAMQEA